MVDEKLKQLKKLLVCMKSVLVAYSGGTDSTLLLKVSHEALGGKAIGLTVVSPSVPKAELVEAQDIANLIGAHHITLPGRETSDPHYIENTPNRCYLCRKITYRDVLAYANKQGIKYILDGSNADDLIDHRPGRKAAMEYGIRSPLQEVGLTKNEIRGLVKDYGLPNWNKPASACLSSRIPYGTPITVQTLSKVEAAEASLKELGLSQLRVRHHGQIARIEIPIDEFNQLLTNRVKVISDLLDLGYKYITLDLVGFRSGSMNEIL